jgi:D-alanyl-lipoteichoic acid acyltransferase DltB (MBOAT superfamily)
MSFHSLEYALFLPLALAAYFLTPARFRWVVLLASSLFFYASWRIEFVALLVFSTTVDYSVARSLSWTQSQWQRNLLLGISLTCNLGLLLAFKFFTQAANSAFYSVFTSESVISTPLLFLLPLGISFYTFQTLGYTIDVYRRRREPERHLGQFAAYVTFFPQLIAGPIERAGRLMPQLQREQVWNWGSIGAGLGLITIGLFKKLVIGDGLAQWLGMSIEDWESASGLSLALMSLGTAYRYYADLSGYADIAIGSALLFGIKLSQNFSRPFSAPSLVSFWQRWHITVTNWFRDYLYIPLVKKLGSGELARFFGVLVTMFVVGLWHGATLNWLLLGLVSGIVIGASNAARKKLTKSGMFNARIKLWFDLLERLILWVFLLFMGAVIAMPDFGEAMIVASRIAEIPVELLRTGDFSLTNLPAHLIIAIVCLEIYQWLDQRSSLHDCLAQRSFALAVAFYCAIGTSIVLFGTFDTPDFLYFQF